MQYIARDSPVSWMNLEIALDILSRNRPKSSTDSLPVLLWWPHDLAWGSHKRCKNECTICLVHKRSRLSSHQTLCTARHTVREFQLRPARGMCTTWAWFYRHMLGPRMWWWRRRDRQLRLNTTRGAATRRDSTPWFCNAWNFRKLRKLSLCKMQGNMKWSGSRGKPPARISDDYANKDACVIAPGVKRERNILKKQKTGKNKKRIIRLGLKLRQLEIGNKKLFVGILPTAKCKFFLVVLMRRV